MHKIIACFFFLFSFLNSDAQTIDSITICRTYFHDDITDGNSNWTEITLTTVIDSIGQGDILVRMSQQGPGQPVLRNNYFYSGSHRLDSSQFYSRDLAGVEFLRATYSRSYNSLDSITSERSDYKTNPALGQGMLNTWDYDTVNRITTQRLGGHDTWQSHVDRINRWTKDSRHRITCYFGYDADTVNPFSRRYCTYTSFDSLLTQMDSSGTYFNDSIYIEYDSLNRRSVEHLRWRINSTVQLEQKTYHYYASGLLAGYTREVRSQNDTAWNPCMETKSYFYDSGNRLSYYLTQNCMQNVFENCRYTYSVSDMPDSIIFYQNANSYFRYDTTVYERSGVIGIPELETSGFSIYPNPATGTFRITTNAEFIIGEMDLYNLQGQRIQSYDVSPELISREYSLFNVVPGYYFIHLTARNGRQLLARLVVL